jgi:GNAT superfamily N-acetyltransferase
MGELSLREAQESDLRHILDIYAQPGVDDGEVFTEAEARLHYQRFRQYPSYRLFVAVLDGQIVGTFALLIMDNLAHRGAPSAVVEDVAVRPELQGRGIGRRMMEFARERCREAGCYKMALSSNLKRGPAHAFYDSLGFERHGYSFVIRP